MSRGEFGPQQGSVTIGKLARVATVALCLLLLGAWAPSEARAQRTERFALSAHTVLGVGGRLDKDVSGYLGSSDATGFAAFEDLGLFGYLGSGSLRPSPGLGLRLSFVGHRYVSVGLDVVLSSLRGAQGAAARFSDVGLLLAARLPLTLGATGRLVTPYVALPLGFSSMHNALPASGRLHDVGSYVGGLVGVELELLPGFGVYLEAGVRHRRVQGDNAFFAEGRYYVATTTRQAVLHLGLRAAR